MANVNAKTNTTPRFDYQAACKEVADPIAKKLPIELLQVYYDLRDKPEYEGLKQGPDLDVPIPREIALRLRSYLAGGVPATCDQPNPARLATLALASWAIHNAGHWQSEGYGLKDSRGATWKFSNMADQVLSEVLGLKRERNVATKHGYSVRVGEGTLHLGYSYPGKGRYEEGAFWIQREVGPATPDVFALIDGWKRAHAGHEKAYEFLAHKGLPPEVDPLLCGEQRAAYTVVERYMRVPGQGSHDCPECGKSRLWMRGPQGCPIRDHEHSCSTFRKAFHFDNAVKELTTLRKLAIEYGGDSAGTHAQVAIDAITRAYGEWGTEAARTEAKEVGNA